MSDSPSKSDGPLIKPLHHEPHGALKVRFWGVRGSIPSPGPDTARYGGNTSCVEVSGGGTLVALDGGTGLRRLGGELMATAKASEVHLFLSHLHWDHIQGIPFFTPAFVPGNKVHFYGERKGELGLRSILEAQMTSPNFPVPLSIMRSEMSFTELEPQSQLKMGALEARTTPLNHPNGCLGIRLSYQGRSVVYTTDTEHDPSGALDERLVALARGADALIYDAMYTDEEYQTRVGWGHSTYSEALRVAREAGVKALYFFHHDPEHDDDFLDQQLALWLPEAERLGLKLEMAREGHSFYL